MAEIFIDRALPTPDAADALHAALKSALGDKVAGISKVRQQIKVVFVGAISPDDENTARQIVLTHDFNVRTPEQTARAERKAELETARGKLNEGRMTKDEQIAYLLMVVEEMQERLGM